MRGIKGQAKPEKMLGSGEWQVIWTIIIIIGASFLGYKTVMSFGVDNPQAVMAQIQAQTEEVQSLSPSKERSAYLTYIKQWAKEDRTNIKIGDSQEISVLYEDAVMAQRQEQNKAQRAQLIETATKPLTNQP